MKYFDDLKNVVRTPPDGIFWICACEVVIVAFLGSELLLFHMFRPYDQLYQWDFPSSLMQYSLWHLIMGLYECPI